MQNADYELSVPVFYDVTKYQIIYLNVRSLHKHVEDVKKYVLFKNANILAFSLTRLSETDISALYETDRYNLYRYDEKKDDINDRPYHGLAVCYKHSMTFKNLTFFLIDIVLGNLLFKNKNKNFMFYILLTENFCNVHFQKSIRKTIKSVIMYRFQQ